MELWKTVLAFLSLGSQITGSRAEYADENFAMHSKGTTVALKRFALSLLHEMLAPPGAAEPSVTREEVAAMAFDQVFSKYYRTNQPSTSDFQDFVGSVVEEVRSVSTRDMRPPFSADQKPGVTPPQVQLNLSGQRLWHPNGTMSPAQQRMLNQLKAGLVLALKTSNFHQGRALLGQALHLVQDTAAGNHTSTKERENAAYEASLDLLRSTQQQGAFTTVTLADFFQISETREYVTILDASNPGSFIIRALQSQFYDLARFQMLGTQPRARYLLVTFNERGFALAVPRTISPIDVLAALNNPHTLCNNCTQHESVANGEFRMGLQAAIFASRLSDVRTTLVMVVDHQLNESSVQNFENLLFSLISNMLSKQQKIVVLGQASQSMWIDYKDLAEATMGQAIESRDNNRLHSLLHIIHQLGTVRDTVILERRTISTGIIRLSVDSSVRTLHLFLTGLNDTSPTCSIALPNGTAAGNDLHFDSADMLYAMFSSPVNGTWTVDINAGPELLFTAYAESRNNVNLQVMRVHENTENTSVSVKEKLTGNPVLGETLGFEFTDTNMPESRVELQRMDGSTCQTVPALSTFNVSRERQYVKLVTTNPEGQVVTRFRSSILLPTRLNLTIESKYQPAGVLVPGMRQLVKVSNDVQNGSISYQVRVTDSMGYVDFQDVTWSAGWTSGMHQTTEEFNVTVPLNAKTDEMNHIEITSMDLRASTTSYQGNYFIPTVAVLAGPVPSPPSCRVLSETLSSVCTNVPYSSVASDVTEPPSSNASCARIFWEARVELSDSYMEFFDGVKITYTRYLKQTATSTTSLPGVLLGNGEPVVDGKVTRTVRENCCLHSYVVRALDSEGLAGEECLFVRDADRTTTTPKPTTTGRPNLPQTPLPDTPAGTGKRSASTEQLTLAALLAVGSLWSAFALSF